MMITAKYSKFLEALLLRYILKNIYNGLHFFYSATVLDAIRDFLCDPMNVQSTAYGVINTTLPDTGQKIRFGRAIRYILHQVHYGHER